MHAAEVEGQHVAREQDPQTAARPYHNITSSSAALSKMKAPQTELLKAAKINQRFKPSQRNLARASKYRSGSAADRTHNSRNPRETLTKQSLLNRQLQRSLQNTLPQARTEILKKGSLAPSRLCHFGSKKYIIYRTQNWAQRRRPDEPMVHHSHKPAHEKP
ncbi:hypothetical protein Nepgr_025346 [Nepenthes gracilis]|uniref:Uncharacterized protein n=1 Tax=Nepenthes gracilis TaxID=150966 RepID=A0AAD3XZL0_NEPGR|nr:hypothetical protein Nepgr_025346 [Nepenthes gracilis]